jgi:hypothetical protein
MKSRTIFLIVIVVLTGCLSNKKISETIQKRKLKFGVEAGPNLGGIIENTDMSKVEGAPVDGVSDATADGFTGATSMGFHAGGHALIPLGRNDLQAGLNYMFSPQKFTYNDEVNGYFGTRKISLSQLVIPVTYNINLFYRKLDPGILSLKFGGALEYNMPSIKDEGTRLTDYSIRKFSGGIVLGLSVIPFHFNHQSRLGCSVDMYRGSQIFDDFYNCAEYKKSMSSYLKFSAVYWFN